MNRQQFSVPESHVRKQSFIDANMELAWKSAARSQAFSLSVVGDE